ncbi:hypothetical protein IJD44_08425 [bacterium]|nr:hypothetical protein [bacterium]
MNKKQAEEIKEAIQTCKLRLLTIKPHLTDEKTALNESFNKLLIEKAILRDKLMRKDTTFIEKLAKKIKPRKKELICDYFN